MEIIQKNPDPMEKAAASQVTASILPEMLALRPYCLSSWLKLAVKILHMTVARIDARTIASELMLLAIVVQHEPRRENMATTPKRSSATVKMKAIRYNTQVHLEAVL